MAYNIEKQQYQHTARIAGMIADTLAHAVRSIDEMVAASEASTIPAPALTCRQEVTLARSGRDAERLMAEFEIDVEFGVGL